MSVKSYRKKPVVIQAVLYTGKNKGEIYDFTNGIAHGVADGTTIMTIPTLEGEMKVRIGDYVIKGVKGEFYPCKPDIFQATYEEVTDPILL